MRKLSLLLSIAWIWCSSLATPTSAQIQSTDTDIQKLQAQKDRAQLEADIAKAEKDKAEAEIMALRARIGSLSTTNPAQGKITTDNVVIEGNYLGYMAATSAARVIAGKLP